MYKKTASPAGKYSSYGILRTKKKKKAFLPLLEICIPLQPAGSQCSHWQSKPWEVKHNSTEANLSFSCFFILVLCLIPETRAPVYQAKGKPWAQWSILALTWSRSSSTLVCHCHWLSHAEQEIQPSFPSSA